MNSNIEVYVDSGFLYLPLLFDPAIETEIQKRQATEKASNISESPNSKTVIEANGKYFVKALPLQSLLASYKHLYPYSFQQLRRTSLRKHHLSTKGEGVWAYEPLRTILFKVMPYFIKKNSGFNRKSLDETDMLDLIGRKISIPQRYFQEAEAFLDLESLRKMLNDLDNQTPLIQPPQSGRITARRLRDWFDEAIYADIVQSESEHLRDSLTLREQLKHTKPEHVAILLYIADSGVLEIDDFGFLKGGSKNEYLVYKHTGEYVLKDYYGRSYLFPDCRVAVSTSGPFVPIVIEKYKHPFLYRHDPGQEICLRDSCPPDEFNADNIIKVLEEGINALLYGYNGRRRNGYHSLDPTRQYIRTIEFVDYRI